MSPILWMWSLRLREVKLGEVEHSLSEGGALRAKGVVDRFWGTNKNL